jgi:uncharacterized protein (DUF1499 family)
MAGFAVNGFGSSGLAESSAPVPVRLKPCPDSPNCVSSLSSDPQRAVAPIACSGSISETRRNLLKVISAMPRTHIVRDEETYLHVEFTSGVFRFVDDVEFFFDEEFKRIDVRSASRVGYWDMGANRKRIEEIRRMMGQGVSPETNP